MDHQGKFIQKKMNVSILWWKVAKSTNSIGIDDLEKYFSYVYFRYFLVVHSMREIQLNFYLFNTYQLIEFYSLLRLTLENFRSSISNIIDPIADRQKTKKHTCVGLKQLNVNSIVDNYSFCYCLLLFYFMLRY